MKTILIVDDEKAILDTLVRILEREKFKAYKAKDVQSATTILQTQDIDVILTDLKMPGISGMELLKIAKKISPTTEVIIMTAYGSVETAVAAMKEGAYDFITKPVKKVHLIKTLNKALEKADLVAENLRLRRELEVHLKTNMMVGNSPSFRQLITLIKQVAPSDATILLQGESGTGKELAAQTIHSFSLRSKKPFITVNCGALPDNIIESELFGYEKGAFTGANSQRQGRFRVASGGTIFLDEIGELPFHLQVKLLRVLQEGTIEPLGSDKTIQTDVRIIAATNKNLAKEVEAGKFREDLYYRLKVIEIEIPPLRNRLEDIPLLATHFLNIFNRKNKKKIQGFDDSVTNILTSYSWPGNIRELENIIERAVVLSRNNFLSVEDLPPELAGINPNTKIISIPIGMTLDKVEKKLMEATLSFTNGNKQAAAKLLGIATRTIYRRMNTELESDKTK